MSMKMFMLKVTIVYIQRKATKAHILKFKRARRALHQIVFDNDADYLSHYCDPKIEMQATVINNKIFIENIKK